MAPKSPTHERKSAMPLTVPPHPAEDPVSRCLEALRRTGCRVTPQRRLIVETLLGTPGEHLNAQELFSRLRRQDPTMGLATVYRTVELLADLGLVHRLHQDEGFVRFGLAEGHATVRLVCRCCGHAENAPPEVLSALEKWSQDSSFSLVPQGVAFIGTCLSCQKRREEGGLPRAICDQCGCGRRRRGCPRREED